MTVTRKSASRGAAFAAALAAVAVAAASGGTGSTAIAEEVGPREKSRALTAAPSMDTEGPMLAPEQARAATAGPAESIPLPTGGNFNGIRWEELGGPVSARMSQRMLQYNAACQWWRAYRDGRETAVAADILRDLPRWNALRDAETGAAAAQVSSQLLAGGGPGAAGVVGDCDASLVSERAYAQSIGLPPST